MTSKIDDQPAGERANVSLNRRMAATREASVESILFATCFISRDWLTAHHRLQRANKKAPAPWAQIHYKAGCDWEHSPACALCARKHTRERARARWLIGFVWAANWNITPRVHEISPYSLMRNNSLSINTTRPGCITLCRTRLADVLQLIVGAESDCCDEMCVSR